MASNGFDPRLAQARSTPERERASEERSRRQGSHARSQTPRRQELLPMLQALRTGRSTVLKVEELQRTVNGDGRLDLQIHSAMSCNHVLERRQCLRCRILDFEAYRNQ